MNRLTEDWVRSMGRDALSRHALTDFVAVMKTTKWITPLIFKSSTPYMPLSDFSEVERQVLIDPSNNL